MTRTTRGLAALGLALLLVASATAAAAAPATITFADDTSLTSTLQQVIQQSNDEQTQAIATSNVSLVTDTVTGAYAQQLTSTLQDMLRSHVTSIALVDLEWGPVTVAADGSSAVVTSYETWQITSRDGVEPVTDQPTRNDYTLVQDNGTWKINSDTQTVGAPTPVPTDTPTVTPTPTITPTLTDTPTPTPSPVPTDTPTPEPQPTEAD